MSNRKNYSLRVNFSDKQWFLLAMSKLIPCRDQTVQVHPETNEVQGKESNVKSFCQVLQWNLNRMKPFVYHLNIDIPCKDLQFEMLKEWECTVFDKFQIINIAKILQKSYPEFSGRVGTQLKKIIGKESVTQKSRFFWAYFQKKNQVLKRVKSFQEEYQKRYDPLIKGFCNSFENTMKCPPQWENQKKNVQTFKVDGNSEQYQKVQKLSKYAGTISKLIRIQNKPLFYKYLTQKVYLKTVNQQKEPEVKTLFHGNKNIDPVLIYEDIQQGFNVNTLGQSKSLGRGIYFSKDPKYSYKQSYPEQGAEKSMLLCQVIVGQSQKITTNNKKDTEYKNVKKKIKYESGIGQVDGFQCYVVFKNKRAYPKYLITFNSK